MQEVIRFPSEAETIRRDAEAFRRLSPAERFRVLGDMIAAGRKLMRNSPRRDFAERQREADEAEWQRIQKELFARHDK